MPDSLSPDQRRARILHKLTENDRVIARDLAEEFGTSEDAIRRDLRDLAAAGQCKRIYGGALALSPAQGRFAERVDTYLAAKNALARAALPLIESGQTLFIDSGSTNLMLADILPGDLALTVVTNSVSIATTLFRRPGISLVLIGGMSIPISMARSGRRRSTRSDSSARTCRSSAYVRSIPAMALPRSTRAMRTSSAQRWEAQTGSRCCPRRKSSALRRRIASCR